MLFGIALRVAPDVGDIFLVQAVIAVAIEAAYFIAFWTSDARATLGMRLLKLQVGNAFDGRKLDLGQAVRRWIALGGWLTALGYSQASAGFSGTAPPPRSIVLLVTVSPTKQGLHDRFANSAIVQPIGGFVERPVARLPADHRLRLRLRERDPRADLPGRTGLHDPVQRRDVRGAVGRPTASRPTRSSGHRW